MRKVLVIGAGLAGAFTARALARAGCEVTLRDAAPDPATRASGNPAGLIKPHLTRTLTPPSRFSFLAFDFLLEPLSDLERAGHAMRRSPSGLLQLMRDETDASKLREALAERGIGPEIAEPLDAREAGRRLGWPAPHGAIWFPRGGWVEPSDLVLQAIADARASGKLDAKWNAPFALDGNPLPPCDAVVFCLAEKSRMLPDFARIPTQIIRGQITEITLPEEVAFPDFPIIFKEYAIPLEGRRLVLGATHDRGVESTEPRPEDHLRLLERIGARLPEAVLRVAREDPAPRLRAGLRFTAATHLPVAGALPETSRLIGRPAFALTALGSRGILFAPLAAEILADAILGRPARLPEDLLSNLSPFPGSRPG
jgi:tRNA 5-methylaminomethyl-2-thiouridine biosynthesis bifunctional protein